jgi:hypothetical protein
MRMRWSATSTRALPTAAAPAAARRPAIIFSPVRVRGPTRFLGGISTAAGGDVTLIAGDDVVSVPTVPSSSQWPGASGTYGAGNVTIIAGNQITGNYTLANGTARCSRACQVSGAQASALQNRTIDPTTYASDVERFGNGGHPKLQRQWEHRRRVRRERPGDVEFDQGSWNAWAANNIYIKEVNNPNGTFNSLQSFLSITRRMRRRISGRATRLNLSAQI